MLLTELQLRAKMLATYPAYSYVVTGSNETGVTLIGPDNRLLELTWPEAKDHLVRLLCGPIVNDRETI
jgi:hypothetical protein